MIKRNESPKNYDCIVIGAGAAGLACAQHLLDHKQKILIVEARSRIGGRAHTVRAPSLDFPIELGAEFIHGAPKEIFKRVEAAGLSFYDLDEEHLERRNGRLRRVKTFEKLTRLFEKLDVKRQPDRSIADFLKARKLSTDVRALAEAYVEGFHAADVQLIGERGLAVAEQEGETLNGADSFRIVQGYDKLMTSFLPEGKERGEIVRLETVVKSITWKRGKARLQVQSATGAELPELAAKKVVITIPLGVLKASASAPSFVDIRPRPKELDRALQGLEMGHTFRISFRFRSRSLWEDLVPDTPLAFLHATPSHPFPTWWTMAPMRVPLLVAWQGGPKAEALSKVSEAERVERALQTLAYLLGRDMKRVREEVVSWHTHDWSNDPFSYGAYSYVGIDGDRKSRRLTKPFEDTLYFAGEATHERAERGTIDGAVDTGLRAAKQILDSLG